MRTADFSFDLPEELIAQSPTENRSDSRLLFFDRGTGGRKHLRFPDILDIFAENDILVFNRSRVIPARIMLEHKRELFLCEQTGGSSQKPVWLCMTRPGRKFRAGESVGLPDGSVATVQMVLEDGMRQVEFSPRDDFWQMLERIGSTPLPPYIKRELSRSDLDRYQTVYAQERGSVAAPTAGLHFDEHILQELRRKGVQTEFVTLHVGPGTFLPVKAQNIRDHRMHIEHYEICEATAKAINTGKQQGKKITAIGSTSLRTLESGVDKHGNLLAGAGSTGIFLYPPAEFKVVDHFFTNFHLPKSTLLMLVAAFASPGDTKGKDLVLQLYREAIDNRYRFFSYGDASLFW